MEILYATDGSEGALEGARFLGALARTQKKVRVITVVSELSDSEGEHALSAARYALSASSVDAQYECRRGNPADQILAAAEEAPPDLIVVGTRGLGAVARFFLGSVAERVARHATCPVLIARPPVGPLRRILVGADGSACSEYAVRWLNQLPLPEPATIRLVTVLPSPTEIMRASRLAPLPLTEDPAAFNHRVRAEAEERLDILAASLKSAGRSVETLVHEGHGAMGLLEAAESWPADLLVVGAHGMSAIDRFLLGSVSQQALRYAPCSVLVVKETKADTGELH